MATKPAKPKKPPAPRTIKSFFKLIAEDKVDDVKAQLAKGMDPNIRFDRGYGEETALQQACNRGSLGCAEVLLDAGAEVNATGRRGYTALHTACDSTNLTTVELLLARGATIEAETEDGKTPYALASSAPIRALLKRHGARGMPAPGGKVLTARVVEGAKNVDVERGAIGVGGDGKVWFVGYKGLFRNDGTTITRFVFEDSMAFGAVQPGPSGVTYFATNCGLLQFANDTFTLFTSDNSELFDQHLTDLYTSPDGKAYTVSYESEADHKHISVFDGQTFQTLAPGVDFPPELEIKCLAFDTRGELIIGAEGALAYRRAGEWHVDRELHESVFSAHLYDIAVDGDTWWIGTQSGVIEYRPDRKAFHKTPALAKCLCKDGDSLWIGMYFGGLGRLRNGELTVIEKASSELPHEDVEGLVRDRDGKVWIRAGGGVAYIDGDDVRRFD
jgi:hypothetical protein